MTNTQIETKNFKMKVLCEANLNKKKQFFTLYKGKHHKPCLHLWFCFQLIFKAHFTHHKHRERERERERERGSNKIFYIYIDSKPTNLNKYF